MSRVLLVLLLAGTAGAQTTFLGVSCDSKARGEGGVRVDRIVTGSAAERIGLAGGDLLVGFGGEEVSTYDELLERVRGRAIGEAIVVEFARDGRRHWVVPVLADETRPGFEPIPAPDPLAEALEILAAAAGRACVGGRAEDCVESARALEAAIRLHLAGALLALDEVPARALEDRARAAQETARWFRDRAANPPPVVGDSGEGVPCPVELEVTAAGRFAVRAGTLGRSDRMVTALLRREDGTVEQIEATLSGRDRIESRAALEVGDRLEWVEVE